MVWLTVCLFFVLSFCAATTPELTLVAAVDGELSFSLALFALPRVLRTVSLPQLPCTMLNATDEHRSRVGGALHISCSQFRCVLRPAAARPRTDIAANCSARLSEEVDVRDLTQQEGARSRPAPGRAASMLPAGPAVSQLAGLDGALTTHCEVLVRHASSMARRNGIPGWAWCVPLIFLAHIRSIGAIAEFRDLERESRNLEF